MPMTLLQRLPGLQKAPSVRNGLSYLMDGARNLFAVVGDFNVHHKIPLDFFRELHILTVRKLMFPFFEPNLFPLLEGGRLIFYTFVQRGQTRYAAQLYLHLTICFLLLSHPIHQLVFAYQSHTVQQMGCSSDHPVSFLSPKGWKKPS